MDRSSSLQFAINVKERPAPSRDTVLHSPSRYPNFLHDFEIAGYADIVIQFDVRCGSISHLELTDDDIAAVQNEIDTRHKKLGLWV